MILKEQCPVCNKEIKSIQTSFIAMGKLHEVFNCGHLAVRNSIVPKEDKLASFMDEELGIKPTAQAVVSPFETVSDIGEELNNRAKSVSRDFTSNPPTKEELYDNLDRWVSDGGAYKKSDKELEDEAFWAPYDNNPKYWSTIKGDKKLRPYQYEGVRFAESAQLKCLIGDSMSLGKTAQAILAIKRNKAIATPCLILVRGATVLQWCKEIREWYSDAFSAVLPIMDRIHIMPGFDCYVMSQDLLAKKGVLDMVKKLNIKCVIVDEVQFYKDTDSERCKALYKCITDNKIEYRIALSGTYIKNRMSEAFTVLNLLDPKNFNSPAEFKRKWLVPNEKGVYTRLNPVYEQSFKRMTSKYIIRREREQVIKDLPAVTRDYQIIEITDPYIKKTYNHELGLYESFKKDPKMTSTQILGWLARLRAITGQAKVSHAVEWTNEFLQSSDNNITIGIHHNNVRETLYNVFKANKLNPLSLSGADDSYQKSKIATAFSTGQNRILIMNMLAGGVGLSLHNCTNALVLERCWNSADEEQFEGRFRDLILKKVGITITYMIAKGTIDEFFHDLVWQKRNILAQAGIGNPDEETNSISFLKEFAEFISGKTL